MNLTTPFDLKVRTALALIWSLFLQPASRRTTRSGLQLAGLPPRRADYPSLAEYEHAKSRYAAGTPIAAGQVGLGEVE